MTDITELAQRTDSLMDNALETAKQLRELSESSVAEAIFESIVENENGKEIQFERPISDLAYAAFLQLERLVEALEKAQQRIDELYQAISAQKETITRLAKESNRLFDDRVSINRAWTESETNNAVLRDRIAELEDAEQKLCAANVTLDARAELAERHLAELESRSVTVKLPDLRQVVSGDRYVWSDGVFNYSQDVKAELTAKGIKWEAE